MHITTTRPPRLPVHMQGRARHRLRLLQSGSDSDSDSDSDNASVEQELSHRLEATGGAMDSASSLQRESASASESESDEDMPGLVSDSESESDSESDEETVALTAPLLRCAWAGLAAARGAVLTLQLARGEACSRPAWIATVRRPTRSSRHDSHSSKMPPLALAACLALLGGSSAATIHVAPDSGSIATADGSASRPFATLGAAHEAARTLLAAGPLTEDLTVSCAAGTYELAEPLVFTERDGGRDGHRVIWSGPADGVGEARVLGGTRLGGWELAWGEVYRMRLGRRIYGLSENGKQANPARHPNTSPGEGSGWLEASVTNHGMTVSAGSLPPNVSHFGLGNASVRMAAGTNYYWSEDWAIDSFSLSATGAGTATFRQDRAKIASKMQAGPHCVAYGSAGFLDEPGEFALDSQGEWLFYWPRSGLPIESLEIVAPTSQRPVSVVGASFVDGKVTTGLSLRGLSFVGSDGTDSWYLFDQRMSNSVPEGQQQGLIFMENATDIEVIDCKILSATVSGIWLNKAVSGVVIRGNWIEARTLRLFSQSPR